MCYYPFFPGTDLPDDDYTTLVPQSKPANVNNRKTSTVDENKIKKKSIDERKTTITGISRRRSTLEQAFINHTRSAPPSPATNYTGKPRYSQGKVSFDQIENETNSITSEYQSSANGPSNCISSGTLEIRLKFDAKNNKMWVFVIKATLEMTQHLPRQTLVQVHLTVLPYKRLRFRTRVKPVQNAMFAEEFFCKVTPETIQNEGIRFRLYTYERFKRVKLLAEATVMFATANLDEDMCKVIPLECFDPLQDSEARSRSNSRQESIFRPRDERINSLLPELEIGLSYDKNQSMLTLEIGKGINFGMLLQTRAPDTYIQIAIRDLKGEEMISNRTMTKNGQYHPTFAERYPFNIQENYLNQITIFISIINKQSPNKNEQIFGCLVFGHDATGNAQISHWESMLNAQGETITRWHSLSDV